MDHMNGAGVGLAAQGDDSLPNEHEAQTCSVSHANMDEIGRQTSKEPL